MVANRCYPQFGSDYSVFVGYYYILPLNTIFSSSAQAMSISENAFAGLPISFDSDKHNFPSVEMCMGITPGMTYEQVTQIIGQPQALKASGMLIVAYNLSDTDAQLVVEYIYTNNQFVVRTCELIGGTKS